MQLRPEDYVDPRTAHHGLNSNITEEEKEAVNSIHLKHPMVVLDDMYESEEYRAEVTEAIAPYVEICKTQNKKVKKPCSVNIAFFEAAASMAEMLAKKYNVSKSMIGRAIVMMEMERSNQND